MALGNFEWMRLSFRECSLQLSRHGCAVFLQPEASALEETFAISLMEMLSFGRKAVYSPVRCLLQGILQRLSRQMACWHPAKC
mmetsp:Transcript_14010/g.26930  ORF Transcript_14010/g.26930 Transcript_14010/m.26930 type:complete len:83 (-) Transcript_14010:961-1209(-)